MSAFDRNRLKTFLSVFLTLILYSVIIIFLLSAGYTSNEKQDSFLIVVGMMIVLIAFCYMLGPFSPAQIKTNTLFGREDDQKKLFHTIFQGQHSIVNLVGAPGVGKTALTISTAYQLQKMDVCNIYIDVSRHNTTSSLINALVSNTTCTSTVAQLSYLCLSAVDLAPQKLLINWTKLLSSNTLLIFDNIEGIWYKQLNLLYEHIIQPLISVRTDLKLLLVSRYYEFMFHDKDAIISLSAINKNDCIAWILHTEEHVNVTEAQKLCQLVGGVPKAVELLLSYALNPMTAESVSDIINALNVSEYGEPFRQYKQLLNISDGSHHFIKALNLLYDLLSSEDRICIWLLVGTESNVFNRSMAMTLLHNTSIDPSKCLRGLLSHSLLEMENFESSDHNFRFHPFIKEFIRWKGNPVHNEESVRIAVRNFYANYVLYHTTNLCDILHSTNSVQLAVRIGSNRQLINNMLPLLRGKYTNLYRLFKIALKVIEKQCCSVAGYCITTESFANVILSFSYLTKAVHCPDFHAVSLLLNEDERKSQSPNKCLQKLQACDAVINGMLQAKNRTDYKTAEAMGYYNTLKFLAHPSPPLRLSLLDVAMIITTANHECHLHHQTRTYLCGEESSIELGLKLLLLQNYARSERHLIRAFDTLEDDHRCKTILKVITMMALYFTNYCPTKECSSRVTVKKYLETINYEALNSTCFIGIMNDVILPFLIESDVQLDSHLIKGLVNKHFHTVDTLNNTCQQEADLEEERLDCNPFNRYAISYGVTALKLFVAEWAEDIDDEDQREDWICSIIMDKTERCKNVFPLFSKVRKIETNENSKIIRGLKFFMTDKEFSELEKRISDVSTTFYQLMSI